MARLRALAAAKLNLALHITGIRADGYHDIESLVVFADYGDIITLDESDRFSLAVEGRFAADVGDLENNLVWRAAHVLAHTVGGSPRGALRLDKRLPVGAGLGGGSMDAVAACRLLLKSWGHIMPDFRLAEILLPLGADMPLCVAGVPLVASGIGEHVTPIRDFPVLHAVLCWPGVSLPTARVYGAYEHELRSLEALDRVNGTAAEVIAKLESTRNMLQRAAISIAPEVAEALLAMETHHTRPFTRMSGSGACCVGYVNTESAADQLAAALRDAYPTWWVQRVKTVN